LHPPYGTLIASATRRRNSGSNSSVNHGLRRGQQATAEVEILGMAADQQGQAHLRQQRHDAGVPGGRADRHRRLVAAAGQYAGVAEPHRQKRHPGFVVEHRGVHS